MLTLRGHYTKVKETPLRAWIDVNDGDPKALRKNLFARAKNDAKAYEMLMDDYIQTFGISDDLQKLLDKKTRLAKKIMEYLQDVRANKKMLNRINIMEAELAMQEKKEGAKIIDLISQLRLKGTIIDIEKDTVYVFENIVRNLKHVNNHGK